MARVLHPLWCRCHGSYASQNSQAGANIFHCVCFHVCWYSPFCAECPAAHWGCQDTLPPSVFVPFQPGGGSARRLDLSPFLPPSLQSLFGFSGHSRRVSLWYHCVILAITDISLPAESLVVPERLLPQLALVTVLQLLPPVIWSPFSSEDMRADSLSWNIPGKVRLVDSISGPECHDSY